MKWQWHDMYELAAVFLQGMSLFNVYETPIKTDLITFGET
jgi:hypothetical protein